MPLTDKQRAKLEALKIGDVLRPSHVDAIAAVLAGNATMRAALAAYAALPSRNEFGMCPLCKSEETGWHEWDCPYRVARSAQAKLEVGE